MKRAIILKHVPFEGPARLQPLLEARGYTLDIREVFRGDTVPPHLSHEEVLIVLGGPMGVGDMEHPEYPFLRQEQALLEACLTRNSPVLGICLGAQLLAAAAGAAVRPMKDASGQRMYEVGFGPLRLLPTGSAHDVLEGLPEQAPVLHWHGDTFDLPAHARRLASTEICQNQAFQLRDKQFGLQFHCEMGREAVDDLLRVDEDFAELANGVGAASKIHTDMELQLPAVQALGDRLLSNILDRMTHPA
jgi:GMP synthase (glutamine-hydrolysing)